MPEPTHHHAPRSEYFSAIDGLRAVAILLVLFFHANAPIFVYGFVGVDVFFVISGFLITRILIKDLRSNTFSLRTFYERRIRRIFPALAVTLLLTFVAGLFLYNNSDLLSLSESSAASILSLANFYFHSKIGYFDTPALSKPLLHIWSLAVEEQFYLLYPLTLFALWRLGNRFTNHKGFVAAGFSALFVASLVAYVWVNQSNPQDTFYLPYYRAWELMAGGFIALFPFNITKPLREAALLLGLGLILLSAWLNVDGLLFSGAVALLPVLGSALVICAIAAGENTSGKTLLGNPLMVFIGKISYSLYLLHWPIIVFARYYAIKPLNPLQMALLLLVCFAAASLSWKLVETPFRSPELLSKSRVFWAAAGVIAFVLVAHLLTTTTNGIPSRYESANIAPLESWNYEQAIYIHCDGFKRKTIDECIIGAQNTEPSFLLWGDSHARYVATSAAHAGEQIGASGVLISENRCPPILNVLFFNQGLPDNTCDKNNRAAMAYLESHPNITTIVLAARWPLYTEGVETLLAEQSLAPNRMVELKKKPNLQEGNKAVFTRLFAETVNTLVKKGYKVVVLKSVPELEYDLPQANFIASISGRDTNALVAPSLDFYTTRNQAVQAAFQKAATTQPSLTFIDTLPVFCPNGVTCDVLQNDLPLYEDQDHLSTIGQLRLVPNFIEALR